MVTLRQRKAVDNLVENGGNVTRAMIDAGYRPASANNPKVLTDSKGFKELCEEAGLTDNFLIKALYEDIEKKPQNRKAELELAFKVKGKLHDSPESNKTLILIVSGESANRFNVQSTQQSKTDSE